MGETYEKYSHQFYAYDTYVERPRAAPMPVDLRGKKRKSKVKAVAKRRGLKT